MTSRAYTQAELAAIADYVMPPVPEQPADLALLFGTRHGVPAFCAATLSLWERGMFKLLVISGGKTRGQADSEAAVIAAGLLALGIPRDVMLLEEQAMNTGENVIYAREQVAGSIGLAAVASVLVIGKVCSLRRYLMTLERHWPGLLHGACPVNYFGVEVTDWHQDDEFRRRVLQEYEKIPHYLQAGFLREIRLTA